METVGAQAEDVTLQIWPSKGAIQFEEGTLNEQQVYRQEANISMLVLLACRLHLAVSEVAYKTISYRRRPGGKEEIQYYYEVTVPPSAAEEILSKEGVAEKAGTPGWIETQTGSIQGSEEDWLLLKGTMGLLGYDKAREVEELKDRTVHVLVIASGGAYRDHEQFAGYVWEKADPSHLEFTVALHRTADVRMASEAFRNVVRNRIISSIGARMDPPPDGAAGWSVRKQPLTRALRRVTLPGEQEARLIYVGAKMSGTLVWNGPPEEVGAAREALFMPQLVMMPESVRMQAIEVTPAAEGAKAVMRYTAVATGEAEVHLFWGMAGSPVMLPPMEVATPSAKPEREKWEAGPRKMVAVGGMAAAKVYSDKAVSSRQPKPSGAQERKAKGAAPIVQVNSELAGKIAELLKGSIQSILDEALPGQEIQACEKTAARLGKVRTTPHHTTPPHTTLHHTTPHHTTP